MDTVKRVYKHNHMGNCSLGKKNCVTNEVNFIGEEVFQPDVVKALSCVSEAK